MAITKPEGYNTFRQRLHEVIFEAHTREGKLFDVVLLIVILASVFAVMLESVDFIGIPYSQLFWWLEFIFTVFFTIEYGLRIYAVYSPSRYIFSFFGIIDLLAILPFFISFFLAGTQYLVVIRSLRLLRVFRIFKLVSFVRGGSDILKALKASRAKIFVFLSFILILVVIMGSIIYLVEADADSGFTSIPRSIYWAIVTLTTVGYGDIAPKTEFGQLIAAIVMILGYSVIAVPTGIVSAEMVNTDSVISESEIDTHCCKNCSKEGHDEDADFCKYCGADLH